MGQTDGLTDGRIALFQNALYGGGIISCLACLLHVRV